MPFVWPLIGQNLTWQFQEVIYTFFKSPEGASLKTWPCLRPVWSGRRTRTNGRTYERYELRTSGRASDVAKWEKTSRRNDVRSTRPICQLPRLQDAPARLAEVAPLNHSCQEFPMISLCRLWIVFLHPFCLKRKILLRFVINIIVSTRFKG